MPLAAKINALEQRGIGFLLRPILTAVGRWKGRGIEQIFCDQGIWIHQTHHGYFAYPWPYLRLDLPALDDLARRNFFWGYEPSSGDVVVDVGAGVGEETLTFSRAVGKAGRVICIEAHPRTFRCLEKLVQYNRLSNVTALHRAVSEPGCDLVMIEDSSDYVKNQLKSGIGISVPATTLDSIGEELPLKRIDFLKMNIEGAERFAIRGMTETLKHTKVLCICCHDFLAEAYRDESLRTRQLVRDFLQREGFTVRERQQSDLPEYLRDQLWAYNPESPAALQPSSTSSPDNQ